jgi:RNA exonuclease 4
MAPIELTSLSSNWKKLQATLQSSKSTALPKSREPEEQHASLKRKRPQPTNGTSAHTPSKAVNGTGKTTPRKAPTPQKRRKMEEPASVGALAKRHDTKTPNRSVSMPSLKMNPLITSDVDTAEPVSVLTPHASFPDIENEGVSEAALPGKYVALDCEMVGVGPEPNRDSALARVSMVNYHGHQVYDSYVQVPRKVQVTDFRTAVSGIEPRHIRSDYARTFEEVREDLKILLAGRILVGHAVKNDLDALILKHDRRLIRDTSKFSKFRQLANIPGRTPGLKLLAEKLLGVEIQVGAHSSVEDARATMALYRLDKEAFEKEIRQKYGHIRLEAAGPEVDVGGGEVVKRKNNNNRKKKKKKKN